MKIMRKFVHIQKRKSVNVLISFEINMNNFFIRVPGTIAKQEILAVKNFKIMQEIILSDVILIKLPFKTYFKNTCFKLKLIKRKRHCG